MWPPSQLTTWLIVRNIYTAFIRNKLLKNLYQIYNWKIKQLLDQCQAKLSSEYGTASHEIPSSFTKKKSPDAECWDSQVLIYMIPWGCPFPAIFLEHSSRALWMSFAQEIWDLIMPRYCAYDIDSVWTVSGLVAVGTRLGECLALSILWERHSYASRCTEGTNVSMYYTVIVEILCCLCAAGHTWTDEVWPIAIFKIRWKSLYI